MRYNRLIICVLLTISFGLTSIKAQNSINAAGGNASGSGGSANYSIGQSAYQISNGVDGSLVVGVLQAYEISVVTSVKDYNTIDLTVVAYPNPTSDHLTLKVNDNDFSNLIYKLYDIKGKMLHSEKISSNQTNILMNNLVSSTYFVKIVQSNTEIKTFKIIKK